MKRKNKIYFTSIIVSIFFIISCKDKIKESNTDNSENIITINGSSTVFPIFKNATEIYKQEKSNQNTDVYVEFSGTNKGFEKLISGESDIIGASRCINSKENKLCKDNNFEYVELMIGYDGIVVVVNPKNTWLTSIKKSELKKIWAPESQEKITTWNSVNQKWPNLTINLYGAGKNSGTFDYFTEFINGEKRAARTDFISSEDDNFLVHKIASDSLSLGFFGYHYYIKNSHILKTVAIDNEDGKGIVSPNDSTIKNNLYKPLSRPLFVYVSKESLKKESVKQFLNYFGDHLNDFIRTSEYIVPSESQILRYKEKIEKQIIGSEFLTE